MAPEISLDQLLGLEKITRPSDDDLYVMGIQTGYKTNREIFAWIWAPGQEFEVVRSIGRMASNPDLLLTWYDCAVLSSKIKKIAEDRETGRGGHEGRRTRQ
jgi:hypothetical protein